MEQWPDEYCNEASGDLLLIKTLYRRSGLLANTTESVFLFAKNFVYSLERATYAASCGCGRNCVSHAINPLKKKR